MKFGFSIRWSGYGGEEVVPSDAGCIDVYLSDEDMDDYPDEILIGTIVASTSLSEMIDDWIDSCSGSHGLDAEAIPGLQAMRREFAEQIAKIDAALSAQPAAEIGNPRSE